MKRSEAVNLIADTVRAELDDRRVPPDRDEAWRAVAGNAVDGLNTAAGMLDYARAVSAEVCHATGDRERRVAEHKEQLARLRAWRAAAAVTAELLAAQGDHPFTAEQPEYPGPRFN
jgi:hypothetical protein